MTEGASVAIHVNVELDEEVRNTIEKRCRALAEEFSEVTHLELTLSPDGDGCVASGHATGKSTEVASHATAPEARHAADRLIDTLKQQLRRARDKRIFAHRREAQKNHPRRS